MNARPQREDETSKALCCGFPGKRASYDFLKQMEGVNYLKKILAGKRVLFITHKTSDYIRNSQEINLIKEVCQEIKIFSADAKLTWLKYILSIIVIFLKIIFLSKRKYDVVFLGYLPQFVVPPLHFLFRKKILMIDFYISLYDTIVFDKQLLSPQNFISSIIKWVDKKTITEANYVIIDTKTHGKYFCKELGLDKGKTIILYLEADRNIYYPHQVQKLSDFKNKYLILYFGTMLPLQGTEVILSAIKILEDQPKIFFLIVGPLKKILLEKYANLKNVRFIPWVSQEKLSDYIAMSDLCLAGHFHKTIEKAKRVIPGKAFIYQAMKKPMILGDNQANREIFSENDKDVYFVTIGDEYALAKKIKETYVNSFNQNNLKII